MLGNKFEPIVTCQNWRKLYCHFVTVDEIRKQKKSTGVAKKETSLLVSSFKILWDRIEF